MKLTSGMKNIFSQTIRRPDFRPSDSPENYRYDACLSFVPFYCKMLESFPKQ